MNSKEHKEYIETLKRYSENLLKSEVDVKKFFVDAGIHTKTGRLTKVYSSTETQIGYKFSSPRVTSENNQENK